MRTGIVGLALAFRAASAAGVLAQDTTGTITGRVVDPQGLVIPGATITVIGPQGSQVIVGAGNGRFTAPFLTPGTYTVRAEFQGFRPHELKNVDVRLAQTVDVDLALTVDALTDTVVVVQTVPVIDTTSTTTGVNLDVDTLSQIPVGRRFSDTLYISPGVSSSGGAGAANPSISGASGLENLYVVDGVNITNQGFGALGSYSIVVGSLGNGTPYDFIKEVEVKTGGFESEFGQTTGGVVNLITKSGSNAMRGSVFGYTRPGGLESAFTEVQTPNGTVNTTGTQAGDAGVEIGGRAVRDRVFWFAAVDPEWSRRTFTLYDFPTNDPSYTAVGVPQFGYRGDIRYLGELGEGPLPLDRPHQVKIYGSYAFPFGVNLGTGIDLSSGKPLTPPAANPNYRTAGNFTESTFASPNPNLGQPRSLADGPAIQAPFGVRLGVRYSF